MEALCGGEVYVFHARIVCSDIKFGVRLSIRTTICELERVKECLRQFYYAENVYLSYEECKETRAKHQVHG